MKSKLESLNTDISNLRGIFDNPALRGHLGEVQLEELIRSILPQGLWKRQYQFSDGTTVDVVIEVGAGEDKLLIPVDAKFPLEVVSRWENN
ncbi:DNA recombination protein RmuC, partial [Acinetobacter baumannii]